jgi:hypothetical protein
MASTGLMLASISVLAAGRTLPAHRAVMTLLVQHRSQFPSYVTKIAETRGGVNVAAPICFNPGHITPTTNLTDPYCLADFLVPMRARVPGITQHPIIQMANEVLLYNLKHYGWTVKAFKSVAARYDDLIDGYLFYPQLSSKVGGTGDYKALENLLNLFADELHAMNKTLGVFTPNYHSHFSPVKVLQGTRIDYWLTNLDVKTCEEVGNFYRALHGHGLSAKGGGTLFTSDGEMNSEGCMQQLFAPANKSGGGAGGALVATHSQNMGFYTDFSSMGNVWWPALAQWTAAT